MHVETLAELLAASAETSGGICFIHNASNETFLSYRELYELACRQKDYLSHQGVERGDEVVLQFRDNRNYLVAFWGCVVGGFVPAGLAFAKNKEGAEKLTHVWNILDKPVLYTDVSDYMSDFVLPHVQTLPADMDCRLLYFDEWHTSSEPVKTDGEDIAFLQFSSGSTGNPKGVCLTHANLLANIASIIEQKGLNLVDGTRLLNWMPLTHDMGLIGFHIAPLAAGLNQYIMPTFLFVKQPMLWIKKASEHSINILGSPNFGYRYFIDSFRPEVVDGVDLSSVKQIINGAEPISVELAYEFSELLAPYALPATAIRPAYGMAEACVAVAMSPIGSHFLWHGLDRNRLVVGNPVCNTDDEACMAKFADEGVPVAGVEIEIVDNNGSVLDADHLGHVRIRGANVTQAYYNNHRATALAIAKNGWLTTGDLGFMRNGRLTITGREKDVLFVNGQNYYSHDIERVAAEVDDVKLGKIAVVQLDISSRQSSDIILFCDTKGARHVDFSGLKAQIIAHVSKRIGLVLTDVVAVDRIPKTTSGKLKRYELLEMLSSEKHSYIQS